MPHTSSVLWTESPLLDASSPVPKIACKAMKATLNKLLENRGKGIYAEFEHLKQTRVLASSDEAYSQKASLKNRYSNIVPYDYNRVKIGSSGTHGTYINASFLENASGEYPSWSFIATQGPLKHTIDDFWRMIHEQKCQAIVMLTQFQEKHTEKCAQYFPLDIGEETRTTNFVVKFKDRQDVSRDISVRKFELQYISSGEIREISHYHYHQWPDHGIPQFTRPTRDLVNMLEKSEARRSHIVVHCSAGVGRTGAFCAIAVIVRRLRALQEDFNRSSADCQNNNAIIKEKVDCAINLPRLVALFRTQRDGMVQTIDQYYFCYQAIIQELDAVLSRK